MVYGGNNEKWQVQLSILHGLSTCSTALSLFLGPFILTNREGEQEASGYKMGISVQSIIMLTCWGII